MTEVTTNNCSYINQDLPEVTTNNCSYINKNLPRIVTFQNNDAPNAEKKHTQRKGDNVDDDNDMPHEFIRFLVRIGYDPKHIGSFYEQYQDKIPESDEDYGEWMADFLKPAIYQRLTLKQMGFSKPIQREWQWKIDSGEEELDCVIWDLCSCLPTSTTHVHIEKSHNGNPKSSASNNK